MTINKVNRYKRWTAAECSLARRLRQKGMGLKEIGIIMKRPPSAVGKKLITLQATKPQYPLRFLAAIQRPHTLAALACRFHRKKGAITYLKCLAKRDGHPVERASRAKV